MQAHPQNGSTDMHTKILAALAICMAAAAPATAGEITGKGRSIEPRNDYAESICSFSGLNDGYLDGSEPERVQSFGQDVRLGRANPRFFNPGDACNQGGGDE